MSGVLSTLAMLVDLTHTATMLVWGLGLPLLFWHRFERLSLLYTWFAVLFVVSTVMSRLVLGECFLTTIARELWLASGGFRERVPFTVVLTNTVAGFRPSDRGVVVLWELAVLITSLGSLWSWRKAQARRAAKA